jgi:hypothetical protein
MKAPLSGKPLLALVMLVVLGTAASLLLSIASLITAVQAKEQALPALAFDPARLAVVQSSQCADQAQNGIILTQYDVQYSVMISNSGGRATSLLHATLASGANDDTPWPLALTDAPTNFGLAIDNGHSTFILPPADFPAGQSKRIAINARLRFNENNGSQRSAADEIKANSALHLALSFSNGSKKVLNVPIGLQAVPANGDPPACQHPADFRYQLDSQ